MSNVKVRTALALAAFLGPAACGPAPPSAAPAQPASAPPAAPAAQATPAGPPLAYRCEDGRIVTARYAGEAARLEVGGRSVDLVTARSASGARYVGGGLQWWTKGLEEGRLSQLKPGEDVAADPGVACHAPAVQPPEPGKPGGLPDDRTPLAEGPIAPNSAQGAAQVVQQYAAELEARNYAAAWALWGDGGKASGRATADAFARTFDRYDSWHAQVGAPGRMEGAAGSSYVTVPLVIYGRLKTGAEVHEKADVTLRRVNDVPGSTPDQRRWHIERIEKTSLP